MKKPYLPSVTLDQVLVYDPGKPETFTPSPLVNAVAEAVCVHKLLDCASIARYLCVDARKLAAAMQLEMGMNFTDFLREYRIAKIRKYIQMNPEASLEEVAVANGYTSNSSMWRLFKDRLKETANGKKSFAKEDWGRRMRRRISKL